MTENAHAVAQQLIEQVAARSPMPVDEVVWTEGTAAHKLEFLHREVCLGSMRVATNDVETLELNGVARRWFTLQLEYVLGWLAN